METIQDSDVSYFEARRALRDKGLVPHGKSLAELVPGWRMELNRAIREFFPYGGSEPFPPVTNLDALRIKLWTEDVPQTHIDIICMRYEQNLKVRQRSA